jgi:peptide/nickel transport system substrate-binding protein
MLDATFNGDNILQQGNVNWPELDVPAINAAMKAASVTPVGPARNQAWVRIDHIIAEQAPAVPYLWDNIAAVQSKDVVGVVNGYCTTHDLNSTSIR